MAVYDVLEALRRAAPRSLQRWLDPMLLAERIAFVGATSGHFASIVSMRRLRQVYPWMAHALGCFSIAQSAASLVAELNAFAPTIIATYPSVAALLAEQAERGSLRIALREFWTGGETLGGPVRKRVESALGCAVHDSYGASEFLTIGWECSAGAMHANADWVILEPVDRQHRPVAPGERSHSVLLTNLANHVQPLIRYEIGDCVRMPAQPCSCGSPLPLIEVQGRHDDTLLMAGRGGQTVTLLPLALATVLEDEAGVFDFQLRQLDRRTLVLRLGFGGEAAVAAAARCHSALQAYAREQGMEQLRLRNELGRAIPKGRSGKAQRIVAGKGMGAATGPRPTRNA
jgi:phenylacetate-coenzyme A ligase PaaK-like adenylate-forming protein